MKLFRSLLTLLLLLTACAGNLPSNNAPSPGQTLSPEQTVAAQATPPPLATSTPTPVGPLKLRLWLPPQFDPAANTAAGKLLQQRLNEFSKRRPGVELEVRIKAVYGPGGLLDSLSAASAAAPQAAPDLIALPRDLLEAAALKGLLRPYNNLTKALDSPDWYDYARQLASIQENIYGLPFAGDALALVYRPEAIPEPPTNWSDLPENSPMLVFPAADPQAVFTLALYQSAHGTVRDDQGRPMIETAALTKVLTYYLQAQNVGMMPEVLTQYQSDDQAWDAFIDRRTSMVVTWASRFIGNPSEETAIAPIPTADGKPYTLATGWVWALSSRESRGQQAAIELAEFLTDSAFMAAWNEAAGFLPLRPSSLERWDRLDARPAINVIALSAHALPAADILSSLSGPLWQATIDVLNEQAEPAVAAQQAAASLTGP
jgi:ABC-type glycerol-3-phosphate transport system substrate-binding protein